MALGAIPLRRWDDGRIRLACDVSNWLRPDAETSPERLFCHCYARQGERADDPGLAVLLDRGAGAWPYVVDAAAGRSPARPADDATEVTAAQVRDVVGRLAAAGHWHEGDPDIIVVLDSGYDLTRLAWLLDGLPVDVTGRLRSDRVMYFPVPPRGPGTNGGPSGTGPGSASASRRRGRVAVATATQTSRYGTAKAVAWPRLHQQLARRAAWEHHDGELPVIEGTLIRLQVDHLPGCRDAEPVWLWSSRAAATADEVNRAWQAFLRRFDIEHTFRFLKQQRDRPARSSATRPPPTAGPGSSSPPTPSCTSPATSPRTSACPGSSPASPATSPPPGYGWGSAASARTCLFPPARRNPPTRVPDDPPDRKTSDPPPATTSARPSNAKNPRRKPAARQVK